DRSHEWTHLESQLVHRSNGIFVHPASRLFNEHAHGVKVPSGFTELPRLLLTTLPAAFFAQFPHLALVFSLALCLTALVIHGHSMPAGAMGFFGRYGVGMRQSRSRIARNALAWSVAFFALCQVALAAVIEEYLPQLRDPAYGNRIAELKRRLVQRHDPVAS